MDDIDTAFDDAFRTNRIEAGDDPSTLPNPYSRPSLTDLAPSNHAEAFSSSGGAGGFIPDDDDADAGGGGFILDDADTPASALTMTTKTLHPAAVSFPTPTTKMNPTIKLHPHAIPPSLAPPQYH